MKKRFEQLSIKNGFMKHNGGLLFKKISNKEYEFKTKISKNHLNAAGITHGGYIASIIDAGAGTAAHRSCGSQPCVTISLDIKFMSTTKLGDEIYGFLFVNKLLQLSTFLWTRVDINLIDLKGPIGISNNSCTPYFSTSETGILK